jgi:hypothetical protein
MVPYSNHSNLLGPSQAIATQETNQKIFTPELPPELWSLIFLYGKNPDPTHTSALM